MRLPPLVGLSREERTKGWGEGSRLKVRRHDLRNVNARPHQPRQSIAQVGLFCLRSSIRYTRRSAGYTVTLTSNSVSARPV
jgi:hypothetical protein